MHNLAILYELENKYTLTKKYYLISIEKSANPLVMCNLANLYKKQKQYNEAEETYLLGINKGNKISMNNLADIYTREKKNLRGRKNIFDGN